MRRNGYAGHALIETLHSAQCAFGCLDEVSMRSSSTRSICCCPGCEAAKTGIDTFTLGLAREVASESIRVNAVRPGIIDTEIHASGGLPDRVKQTAPIVPMQPAGTAEEVAHASSGCCRTNRATAPARWSM